MFISLLKMSFWSKFYQNQVKWKYYNQPNFYVAIIQLFKRLQNITPKLAGQVHDECFQNS